MVANVALSKTDGKLLTNTTQYRIIIEALQYYTLTKPEISFAVDKLCQFIHSTPNRKFTLFILLLKFTG